MFQRDIAETLAKRLGEPRHTMQIVVGPRQTGKTTAIKQAVKQSGLPYRLATADLMGSVTGAWIEQEWEQARNLVLSNKPAVLVIDEVQKVEQWSTVVKRLWDEDSWNELDLLVVLSGSSSLLIQKGLSEALTGRFELIRSTHWTLTEMSEAFGYDLETFLRFGGFPGSAAFRADDDRWNTYMRDSIIEATITRDVLQMEDVRKPALMRNLFDLGARYSAQEISYRKLLGQLDDKGNTDTIAHYLTLLSGAGMMTGLQKYERKSLETRRSSPRLMVHDTSLMTASWEGSDSALLEDPALRGHLVETAVGAYLIARSHKEGFEVFWWRDGNHEVDFVVKRGTSLTAIEVKSGRIKNRSGLAEFRRRFPEARPLVVGDGNTPLECFLRGDVPLF